MHVHPHPEPPEPEPTGARVTVELVGGGDPCAELARECEKLTAPLRAIAEKNTAPLRAIAEMVAPLAAMAKKVSAAGRTVAALLKARALAAGQRVLAAGQRVLAAAKRRARVLPRPRRSHRPAIPSPIDSDARPRVQLVQHDLARHAPPRAPVLVNPHATAKLAA